MSLFITMLENSEIPDFNESDVKYFEEDGTTNSYIVYNGKNYRVRAEMLVFNDKGQVFAELSSKPNITGTTYRIPGGSVEPGKSFMAQAIREVNEEARFKVKGVKYTGIHYMDEFNKDTMPKWMKEKLANHPIQYNGFISFVYTGIYNGKFTGHIAEEDKDDMYKKGKWYNVSDVPFREEHVNAINTLNTKP